MVGVGLAAAAAVVGVAWATGALGDDPKAATPPVTTTEVAVPSPAPASDAFPQGVYRYRLTKADIIALDPTLPAVAVSDAVGTYTWTVRNGRIAFRQTDCDCSLTHNAGQYRLDGKAVLVRWPTTWPDGTAFCGENCIDKLGWSFDGKALHVTPATPDRYALIFYGARKPWVKVG